MEHGPFENKRSVPEPECSDRFERLFGRSPDHLTFTPYRVCPVGAHVDHQLGKVTGFAIDKGVTFVWDTDPGGTITLSSMQFPQRASWSVSDTPREKRNDWADLLRGATIALRAHYALRAGIRGVFHGELPIGGLSSSASVTLSFLSALSKANGIRLSAPEMIRFAKEAENNYVGVSSGKLDQSCELYCKKGRLLYLDTKDDQYSLVDPGAGMRPYKIAVFFSGLARTLVSSGYNMRADECRSAAYALLAYAGMPYGKFMDTNMRDVPYDVYLQYKDRLPLPFAKRAEHWYTESERVEKAVDAWRNGDMTAFGQQCFASGRSSIENWETGSPELIRLYEILTHTNGIYGGRFSGAGFKGCCMALIDPAFEEEILDQVKREYLAAFPLLSDRYAAEICETADGVMPG